MFQELISLEEDVFKVLANQKRLEIIHLLHGRELNVTDMAAMLSLRQPNLSQHLTLLRQYKLVEVTRKGHNLYYRLADDNLAKSVALIHQFLENQHKVSAEVDAENIFPIIIDPVCHMRLSVADAFDSIKTDNQTFYFCAGGCRDKFKSNPQKYLKLSSKLSS